MLQNFPYSSLEELRKDYIGKINKAMRKGVVSVRELSRKTGVSKNTIYRYQQKQHIGLKLMRLEDRHRALIQEALSQDFTSKLEFLDYLGYCDGYLRKITSRYGIKIQDFRKISKPSRRWQKGRIAENRSLVDRLLNSGVDYVAIGSRIGLSKHTVYSYKKWREEQN